MKRILLGLAALLILAQPAAGAPRKAASVSWRGWDRGLEEARTSRRPVMVHVYTDWCGWCRRMEADVFSRPDVREYLSRNFVAVKIDAEAADPARFEGHTYTSRSLAARFGVTGYPTTLFLRAGGDRPVSVPGYVDAERFKLLLRYVGEGAIDEGVPFEEFCKRASAPQP